MKRVDYGRDQAQIVCNRQYGQTVPVEVFSQKNRSFSYIPSILRHILFELLKNSMRATVETHENDDEGGGIKRKNIHQVWDYFYTTSKIQVFDKDGTDFGVGAERGTDE